MLDLAISHPVAMLIAFVATLKGVEWLRARQRRRERERPREERFEKLKPLTQADRTHRRRS